MQRMETSVIGVAAPFDVAAFLQLVDVGHDTARQYAQTSAQRLLAAARFGGDGAKYPGVGRGQIDGRHLLGKPRRRIMPQLGE